MKVSLTLFASLRELVGERKLWLEVEDGATVEGLRKRLALQYPAAAALLEKVVFAVDDEYVAKDQRLHEGVDIALIPPVSGGAGAPVATQEALFRLTEEPLEAQALADLVRRDDCGAVALFYGVVRNHSEGRQVERLEYEAHASMALRKMREVAAEAKRAFPAIAEIGVWHRVGMLEIGETSLLVAVASGHRKEAFEACHWAVDRIKEVVPIWKKEHWAGGGAWVEGHAVQPPVSPAAS